MLLIFGRKLSYIKRKNYRLSAFERPIFIDFYTNMLLSKFFKKIAHHFLLDWLEVVQVTLIYFTKKYPSKSYLVLVQIRYAKFATSQSICLPRNAFPKTIRF